MVSLVLSITLISSTGGLLAERTPAAGMLVGAVNLNQAGASLDNLSLTELTTERASLVDSMPSLGLGIALTAAGGGLLIIGLSLLAAEIFEVLVVGLVMMAASVPLLIIGPILLAGAVRERRDSQTRISLIDQRLAEMRRDEVQPQNDGQYETPPPPPMRPPGSQWAPTVPASTLLARF